MEINITGLFNNEYPSDCSASIAEIGIGASKDTWNASKEIAGDYRHINTYEKLEAFISHMVDSGFSEAEEMNKWSFVEIEALFIQMVCGDMREFLGFGENAESWDWEEYEQLAQDGQCVGNIYQGDDNEIYYYLGT